MPDLSNTPAPKPRKPRKTRTYSAKLSQSAVNSALNHKPRKKRAKKPMSTTTRMVIALAVLWVVCKALGGG